MACLSLKDRQEEQQRLVDGGAFAATVGAIFSQLPSTRNLNVADNYARKSLQREIDKKNEIQWLIEEDNFVDILASDMRWKHVDRMEELAEIMPAKFLTTIPLEVLKHGTKLHEFQVDVFPEKKGFSLVAAEPVFCLAFSKLRSFRFGHFGTNHLRIREQPLAGEDLLYMEQYLAACISAPSLRLFDLKLYSFRTHNGEFSDGGQVIDLQQLLSQLNTAELQIVNASDIMVGQSALEHLASSIGDNAAFICMNAIKIQTVSWIEPLDLIHTIGTALRRRKMRCTHRRAIRW